MRPLELAELLTAPTEHPVREALRELAPGNWTRWSSRHWRPPEAWRQVLVSRVKAFAAGQPGDGRPAVAAYFTTTERRAADGMRLGWSPFVAALSDTEAIPDLRPTRTTVTAVPVGEAALAEEVFADPELTAALNRLAVLDPPDHGDILRVHLPTRAVTRIST